MRMKQKLFLNQLSGRWLAVVLALLLMPLGILGQITVAGISPDVNGDIQTSDIQGFDGGSYVAHYSDGVLTLQNVRLEGVNGLIEWSGDTDLTIEFSGTNSIDKQGYTTDVLTPIKSTTGHNLILRAANNSTNAKLYFGCYDLEGTNDLSGVELISGFSQVSATGLSTENSSNSSAKDIVYRVPVTSYNLWIGGVQVTSDNASNVLGDDETPTVVFDAATNTLTLNNLSEESFYANDNPYVVNGLGNLTIHLVGENFVWFSSQFLAKSGTDGDNYNVTFTTDEENRGNLGLRSDTSDWCTGHTVVYNNGLAWIDQGYDNDYHTYEMLIGVEEYDLTVSGVQVTSANASNVLGDDETPTIVFDAATNTLTLNEVDLTVGNEDIIVSGLDNLTIFLVGENLINSGYPAFAFSKSSAVDEATITFTTDRESNGTLIIGKLEQYLFGDGVTPVYNNVSIKHDGDYHTISSSCGISVGGVDVTEFNKGNVFGDGKVSYNSTTHTLTLNNATIAPNDEVAGISFEYDVDLTIALIGNNSIRGGEGCTAISKINGVETPYVYFVKGDANHFSLVLVVNSGKKFIDGFRTNNEGLFFTEEEGNDTHSETISSSMFGGTGSADEPFLIKTADDLKNFAINYNDGRFSNNVHIQLFNDIDCEGLTGFTPIADNSDATFYGVFDGNNKTISNLDFDGTSENASYAGLFGIIDETAVIKNLTLSNCNFSGGENAGAIVAYLQSGTIQDCNVTGCSVETRNAQSPNAGGVAGYIYDGTIQRCNVTGSTVNGTTTYTDGGGVASTGGIAGIIYGGTISACEVENTAITSSHALPIDYQPAGGIVGNCYFDGESATTVSGNAVKGTTTVSSIDNNPDSEGGHTLVGAIVGFYRSATLSNNTYEYTVTVSTRKQTDDAATTTAGYTHRGLGGSVEFDNDSYPEFTAGLTDLADNNGAVMYTQTVTVPGESTQATVTAEQDTYYSTAMISDALAYLVAPGQTVTLNATPAEGYMINTFTATNTTTSTAIETDSVELGDNITQYTFTMPAAPVTVAVTTVAAYGIAVAGIEVTELNYTNVLGDGKVSYNATTHTLTLNNANIVPEDEAVGIYYSGSDNLTISLIGSNSINSGSCSPIRGSETPQLIFAKGDNQPCSLRTENTDGWAIDGFSEKNYGGLFKLESQETEDDETTYYMTLTSTILSGGSGTSADPLIIATANDLKNFASYIRESVIPNTSFVKLSNDIGENGLDCSTLEFEPIGYGSTYFLGTFDGNNKTIKNLTVNDNAGDCVGFVRILGEGGVIKDLTLDNLTLSGGNSSTNSIGGLVGYLNGGTINNCTVQNSNISCKKDSETTSNNSQNPTVGGIAGQAAAGTITNCTLLNSAVNAETFDTWASGANANAGGIVGSVSGGTISGCQVKGTSTVLACYKEFNGSVAAGALFGKYSNGVLSNNTYEYTVTATEKKNVTEQEPSQYLEYQTTSKSGYTQRAIGGEVQENEPTPDVAENNGAVMYTQTVTVTLPEESEQATVIGEDNTYYDTTVISDALAYLVAPGQTVTLNANPGNGYAIASLTATNTTTSAAITTTSTPLEDGIKQYTFTMPDAPVTVAVTAVAAYGVNVAGIEVTELNCTDVLGDGKVSFTLPTQAVEPGAESTPATLTLNGATINGSIVSSLTAELDIHLLGSNVIDAGEDCAFVSTITSSYQMLKFTTVEATPGQLLIKADPNGYKEQFNDSFENGLALAYTSGKRLIGVGAELTPKEGLFWTDQQFTVTGPTGSTLYYRNNMNSQETAYTEPFTLTAGNYNMVGFRKVTVDETEFSLYGEGGAFIVHNKPGFSVVAGTYNEAQNVTLTGLPNMTEGQEDYPQVWYYLGESADDSVRVYSAEDVIEISESTKVSVYILDEDSGKVFKSSTVEAEYVIRKSPELRFYTSEQSYLNEGYTENLDYTDEYTSPVLKGKIGNEYTATLTDLGIVYSSSDEHVATISQTGQITIVGGGFTTITATSQQTDVYSADNTWFTLKVRPADPDVSLAEGAYYTGQELTLQRIGDNGTVYYSYGEKNADERTVYQEAISLPKGCYDFYPYTRCGTDEQNIWSYGNAHRMMYVYDQPQISHASGTYDGSVEVEITNLPESGTYAATVYYYFDDDEDGAVAYEAGSKITITEDKTLKVYIYVEGDSAKNFKTAVIEREYVVRQDAGIAFVKNDEPVETADYTIGGATAQTLPTLQNENGLTVTYTSEDTDVATVNATTGAVTPVGVGVTSIIASWNATATLMAGQATYLLHVYKDLTHESITVTVANATFTGEAVEPEVTVMDGETDITGFVHLAFSNNVEVGTNATVTVTPNGQLETNYYTGSTSETFAINYRTLVVGEDVTFANGQKWASYYNQEETLNLPEGVMAYIVTAIGETAATVAPISYVPVNVPVLIEKDSETTTSNTSASGNLLQGAGSAVNVSAVEGTVYALYNNKLMRVNKGSIPAGRAYLVSTTASPARELTIGIDSTTGIRFVEDGQSTTDQWYTIDGRKLQNKPTAKGLYIKNGKTVVVNNK